MADYLGCICLGLHRALPEHLQRGRGPVSLRGRGEVYVGVAQLSTHQAFLGASQLGGVEHKWLGAPPGLCQLVLWPRRSHAGNRGLQLPLQPVLSRIYCMSLRTGPVPRHGTTLAFFPVPLFTV